MKVLLQKIKDTAHIWSNIAYLLAGIVTGSIELFFAFSVLAFTSWMGHWKGGDWWYFDWAGMYVAFTAIILYNFGVGYIIFPLIPIIVWLTAEKLKESNYFLIGTLWIISVFSAWITGATLWPILTAFGAGLYLRQVEPDITQPHYSVFHSLWHVLTALGMYLLVI